MLLREKTYPDDVLIELIAQDNKEAFALIYDRYWKKLYTTAFRAIGEQQDAEDILQEVFLSLWNRRREIRLRGSLAAYLETSVRYKAINYIEKHITQRNFLALFADTAVQSAHLTPELTLRLKEMNVLIGKTVDAMPPKMQEVYQLSRQQQLSHKEIAELLNISAETVKKHIQHALKLIKEALACSAIPLWVLWECCRVL
ncbi:RNA polymerase sigma factor [Niabella drilacis]|uniref:RNA polymerase sigma-70 factor, ECF subfamily n=1 Tax=Niabella drilacis (strain DSM 25811 / CCM 8410 / CCUG 62505 / LMG 26954 / E90) TaxID=1285928 RepID=A0A1G6X136_NIADE|nr:RNA polymerase sigma-70 factor [Niabella drilacis]SDD71769.1 RNA polymerase sigma-70 factor, ECF subfamily [Niabella drilacis]